MSLINPEYLNNIDKVLFVTHLAIGDFTYMQNCFQELKKNYPNIKIDLWVDESRAKSLLRRWKKSKNYILYDWLNSSGLFNKIYKDTETWWGFHDFMELIKKENYPLIINLVGIKEHRYADYSKLISPKGIRVGIFYKPKFYQLIKKFKFSKLNKKLNLKNLNLSSKDHVTKHYSLWFKELFNLDIQDSCPFINIPPKWVLYGKLKFLKWGINYKNRSYQKVIFINSFAKNKKRSWNFNKVLDLVNSLKKEDKFFDASFIINTMPKEYKQLENCIENFAQQKIFLFTANKSFFQLPAIISLCDLVISVETSVIHLAAALKVPVVALMRQKNPEWVPYGTKYTVINTQKRSDWIDKISADTARDNIIDFYDKILL